MFFVPTQLHVLPVAGQCSPLAVPGAAAGGSQREGDAALWRTRGSNSGRSWNKLKAMSCAQGSLCPTSSFKSSCIKKFMSF